MNQTIQPVVVDEHVAAEALGVSVSWLRKDRYGKRVIPHCKMGGFVKYDLGRVREALIEVERGGTKGRK